MLQGRVIKAYNSFFYVQTAPGLVTCKLRGKFKKSRRELGVVPGDWVSLDILPDGTGVIEEVLPRVCSGLPGRPRVIPEKRPKGIYKEDLNT